jgi:hypothetical protein
MVLKRSAVRNDGYSGSFTVLTGGKKKNKAREK